MKINLHGATSSQIMESVTKPCMLRTVVNLAAGHGDKIFLKVMSLFFVLVLKNQLKVWLNSK